jgi:hypothetical protein
MTALVKQQLFDRGLLAEGSEYLCLEIEGELAEFGVTQLGEEFICYENREAKPRVLRLPVEELRIYTLNRECFYALLAKDLGISGQVQMVTAGVWELGRKSTSEGRAKVLFVESGVSAAALKLLLHTESFRTICVLHHGAISPHPTVTGKAIVCASVEVVGGRMVSDAFMDLEAVCLPHGETGIDLDATPPVLWIAGRSYELPQDRGRPTMGVRYWAYLFENPRAPIDCWDLEREVRPELKRAVPTALGSDSRMDRTAIRELHQEILKTKSELDEAMRDQAASEMEISELNDQLAKLMEQKIADSGLMGAVRLLGDPEKDKARRRVRKALDSVVALISQKDPDLGRVMQEAVGEGREVYLNPPADWNL